MAGRARCGTGRRRRECTIGGAASKLRGRSGSGMCRMRGESGRARTESACRTGTYGLVMDRKGKRRALGMEGDISIFQI